MCECVTVYFKCCSVVCCCRCQNCQWTNSKHVRMRNSSIKPESPRNPRDLFLDHHSKHPETFPELVSRDVIVLMVTGRNVVIYKTETCSGHIEEAVASDFA